jgi:gliding motility-associated-like protein
LPGSANLSSSANSGNQWYLDGVLIPGAISNTYAATTSGLYSVFVTQLGCASTESNGIDIVANDIPAIPTITASRSTSVCAGRTVKLTTNNSVGNSWYKDAVLIPGFTGAGYGASSSGNYTVQNTNANDCISASSAVLTVTINPLPIVPAITGVQQVCEGSSTTFSNTVSGGIWTSSNQAIATVDASGVITALASGTTTINYSVSNVSGCTTTVSRDIIVNAVLAKPVISTTDATTFCTPGSATLNSSALTGNQWYKDGIKIALLSTGSSYSATSSGTYSVFVTNTNGCISAESDPIDIAANASPAVPSLKAVKSTSFCEGGSVRLSTANQTGNIWLKDGAALIGVTGSFYHASASGVYTVVVNNAAGCVTGASSPITVTVNPLPTVSAISGNAQICVGSNTSFSNATVGGIWISNNGTIASVNSAGIVTALQAGTVTISYKVTNPSGCSTTVTKDLTVVDLPSKPIISSNATSFCLPGSMNLNSSEASGNQWYLNGSLIPGAINNVFTATTSGTYTVIATQSGCASNESDGIDLTANVSPDKPSLKAKGNKFTSFCEGNSVKLATTNSTGNSWFKNGVLLPGVTGSFTTITESGVYTVQYTDPNGCISAISSAITVAVLPIPAITAIVGTQQICAGASTQLSNATNGGIWSSNNIGIATINSTGSLNAVAAGTATVSYTVTGANGCINAITKDIAVIALPSVSLIKGPAEVCKGDSAKYTNLTLNGIWTSSNLSVATINSRGTVTALSAGTTVLTYTIKNANNCTSSISKTITVNAAPAIPVIASSAILNICEGNSVPISTNAIGSLLWYRDAVLIDTAVNKNLIAVSIAGVYTARSFNNYCVSAASNTITVTKVPAIAVPSIAGVDQLCVNTSATLSNTMVGGSWSSSNNSFVTVNSQGVITGKSAGVAIVNYTLNNKFGCTNTVSKTIKVNVLPQAPQASSNAALSFCEGKSVVLTSSASSNNIWYRDGAFVDTIFGAQTFLTSQPGTYTSVVYDSNYCVSSFSNLIKVTVISLPAKPVISTNSATSFCLPGSAILNSSATAGNQWYRNSVLIAGATGNNYTATESGTYTSVVSNAGCTGIESDAIDIAANAVVSVPSLKAIKQATVCDGNAVKLITASANNNEWYRNGVLITGVSGNSYTATVSGTYTVKSNNASGCTSGTSTPVIVTILSKQAILPISGDSILCANGTALLNNAVSGGIWSTNDSLIASVNQTGLITANKPGVATISYTLASGTGCVSAVSKNILINPLPNKPNIVANGSTAFCVPGFVYLNTNNVTGNQWYLNGAPIAGANANNLKVTSSGSYSLRAISNGCTSISSDEVDIQANTTQTIPSIKISKTANICEGDTVKLKTASPGVNQWYKNGVLIAGVSGSSLTVVGSGLYTIKTSNTAACVVGTSVGVSISVIPLSIIPAISGNQNICFNNTTVFTNTTANGIWSSNNSAVATINQSGLVSGLAVGTSTIQYRVTSTDGCTNTVSKAITVNALPVLDSIVGVSVLCVNDKSNLVNSVAGGNWTSSNSAIASVNASTGQVTAISAGLAIIRYTFTNANGCSSFVEKTITVNALPVVTASASALSVSKGKEVVLAATGTGTILWSPAANITSPTALITSARVLAKTTYSVTLTNTLGCSNTASVTVDAVEDLFVEPALVFTPNSDGINDKFVIKNIDQYPNNKLQVFDRTGKLLYEKNNYSNTWDGMVGGQLLVKDTYLYILTINDIIVKKGTVTLVR